jgi:hypothetical protein
MTKRELRALFWEDNPHLDRKKIKDYKGDGHMYCTNTRCEFVNWVDSMHRSGRMTDKQAQNITLD